MWEQQVVAAYTGVDRRQPTNNELVANTDSFYPGQAQLIATLTASAESQNGVRPIVRLYQAMFNRKPDSAGLDYQVAVYQGQAQQTGYNQATLMTVANPMSQSSEFTTKYPATMSNVDFVTAVYSNVFRRAPDSAGGAYWVNQLDTGASTRPGMMVAFSESAEFVQNTNAAVDSFLSDCGNGYNWAYYGSLI
jgi:hypothetical protein